MTTDNNPIRPADSLKMFDAGFLIGKRLKQLKQTLIALVELHHLA